MAGKHAKGSSKPRDAPCRGIRPASPAFGQPEKCQAAEHYAEVAAADLGGIGKGALAGVGAGDGDRIGVDVMGRQRYEARLRPDIDILQALAWRMAGWYVPLTRRSWQLRNLFMRWTPDWLSGWMLRRTFVEVDGSALSEAVREATGG